MLMRTLSILAVAVLTPSVIAQSPPSTQSAAADTLSDQQRIIADRMSRVEDKMFQLSKVLQKTDPKQAERLTEAFRESRSRLLRSRMDEVAKLLETSRLSDAADGQKAVMTDLELLLKMLIEEISEFDKRQQEIERLQKLKEQLDRIIAEQSREKLDAEQAAKLKARLAQLRAAAERVADLLKRQDAAALRNANAAKEAKDEGKAAAGQQGEIRRDTQELSREMKSGDVQSGQAKQGAKPGDEPQGRQASGQESPSRELKPHDADPRQSQEQPAGGQEQADKPREPAGNRGGQQAQTGKPSQSGQQSSASPEDDLEKAAESMKGAEESLEEGERAQAMDDQEEAGRQLRSALQRLSREMEEIEKKLDLDRQAREQEKTKEKTRELSEKMQGGEQSGGQQKGGQQQGNQQQGKQQQGGQQQQQGGQQQSGQQQQGGQQQGGQQQSGKQQQQGQQQSGGQQQQSQDSEQEQSPGQQGVEEAVPHQEQAEEDLKSQDPEKAKEEQEKALEKLQEAQEELEDALEQMRREQQEEVLAALEARFHAMLARQTDINATTERLDAVGRANWSRADQLALASAAENQKWVAGEADKAARLLKEEGTTVVFPEIVEDLRDDASEVANRLTSADTGPVVRLMQTDIIELLKEMIEAVKEKRNEEEEGGSGGGGGGSDPSLLPESAELKMLRSSQVRVNRATSLLEDRRADPETDMTQLDADVTRTAKRQEDVTRMAKSMEEARAAEEEAGEEGGP